jgi:hypothetical protein
MANIIPLGHPNLTAHADAEKRIADANLEEATLDPKSGPTVEEYVKAGCDPKNYPPTGYKSKSTPEQIEAAIAAFKKK